MKRCKIINFVEEHAGAVTCGTYAVTMGVMVFMYKKFLDKIAND